MAPLTSPGGQQRPSAEPYGDLQTSTRGSITAGVRTHTQTHTIPSLIDEIDFWCWGTLPCQLMCTGAD